MGRCRVAVPKEYEWMAGDPFWTPVWAVFASEAMTEGGKRAKGWSPRFNGWIPRHCPPVSRRQMRRKKKRQPFPHRPFLPSPSLNSTTIRWTLCTRAAAFSPLSPPPLSPQRLSSYHNNRFFSLLPLIPIPPSLSFSQPEQSSPDGLTLPSHDGRRGGILLRLVILSFRERGGGGERQFTEL